MSASNISEPLSSNTKAEQEIVEDKETAFGKLKRKVINKLTFIKHLPAKLFKKSQSEPVVDSDQTEESSEIVDATIPVQKIGTLVLLKRYRTIIYIFLAVVSIALTAFISHFITSKYYKNQASEVAQLQQKVKGLNEQLLKNQASMDELTAKLLEKQTQLKEAESKLIRNSNRKANQSGGTGGNCVLKSGDMAALKDCIDEYNRSQN